MKRLLTDAQIDDVHGQIRNLPEYAGARSILVNSDPNMAKIAEKVRRDGKQVYELSDRTVFKPDGSPDSARRFFEHARFDVILAGCINHSGMLAEIGRTGVRRRIEGASCPRFGKRRRSRIIAIATESHMNPLSGGGSLKVDHVIAPKAGCKRRVTLPAMAPSGDENAETGT